MSLVVPPFLVKKLTVKGIIGNTQGVKRANNPPRNPNPKIFHSELLDAFMSCDSEVNCVLHFANAVDIDSSGNTIIVGAPGTDGPRDAGATYVYDWNGTNWSYSTIIVGNAADYNQGSDVSISGNGRKFSTGASQQSIY